MLKFLKKIFGDKKTRDVKLLQPIVVEINNEYAKLQELTDEQLLEKTTEFKNYLDEQTKEVRTQIEELQQTLQSNEDYDPAAVHDELDIAKKELLESYEKLLDEILPQAFAVVKDACRRLCGRSWTVMGQKVAWEMVPYDVQLMGGVVLHQGKIAEMATGEGKTLVATLPLYLNALTGNGVHLITVNDYLAQRDSEWMGEIFKFLGLTVGVILTSMSPEQRLNQYACDITYGTNNEFGFDYLRDNMAVAREYQVQRGHNYTIVDEVDSVLVDEARTPLIISGSVGNDDQRFDEMKPKIDRIYKLQNALVSKLVAEAEVLLEKEDDKDAVAEAGKKLFTAFRGLPRHKRLAKVFQEPAYKRLTLDTELEFLREKGKNMHLIDDELFYVIDEKNHTIDLSDKGREELARGSKEGKEYFVLTDIGTEVSKFEHDESVSPEEKLRRKDLLYKEYAEKSDRIHTINQMLRAYSLYEKDIEYVITEEGKVAIVDEFTGRVLPGRRYSDGLHQAIEAKENVKVERDTQTLATITLQNYFRMYHKLSGMTGTAETEEGEFFEIYKLEVVVVPTNKPMTRDDQDDAIYKTKREKFNAVIEKIEEVRNAGKPILVGTASVDASETISRMLKRKAIPHNVLNAKQHQREAEVIQLAGQPGAVTIATNMAGRGTDIKLGAGVKERGGLFILGTERHESRRIDRQLRGRSGRQGDPGISKFFLSLEDDLMRLFGSDKISSVMTRFGLEEGEVIQHPLITRQVENAQKRVEQNNFAIRKRLLEYDNVMNQQREVIYTRRNRALRGERLKTEVFEMLEEYVHDVVGRHYEEALIEKLREEVRSALLVDIHFEPSEWEALHADGVARKIIDAAKEFYRRKEEMLGVDILSRIERFAFLTVIDNKWKEHLREMDDLKEGIGLRAYAQKDPLVEYKSESYNLFIALLDEIRNETVGVSFKLFPQTPEEVQTQRKPQRSRILTSKDEAVNIGMKKEPGAPQPPQVGKQQPVRVEDKIGRNDPCYCGSGKKFKQCHGKNG